MALLKKIRWYHHRIRAMSVPEVLHRVTEMAKRKQDRYASQRFVPLPHDRGSLPGIPGLHEGIDRAQFPDAVLAEWAEPPTNFFLLGQRWPECAPEKKWHLDPVTGKEWPSDRYCFDIDFRHTDAMGDVKYVWELNRLQYLQPCAALAYVRRDAALAEFCCGEIESWIDHNPPHLGVNWASGIELALRVVSIFMVTTLVGESLTSAQRAKIWGTLEVHALWLERYPSKFSSANNHRTAEGLGLFMIGALCPQLTHAARWKAHGWELLCETARLQIFADGVGAEQTPNYTAVVLEMLLLGGIIARAMEMDVPEIYAQRIVAAGEYLRWFTDEGGQQPRIGDDDNARVVGAYRYDETYVRSILGCIAAMAKRPDLTPPQDAPHLRHALFGTPPVAAPGPQGVRIFEQGGYTVGRHGGMMLAMDHGKLGYLSIAAHGHADALAVWLHIGDQPVLVDAGTYLYHSGGTWRSYFRGTRAHNTLCVEATDSSAMSGHFNWSHKAEAKLTGSHVGNDRWWIEAEHDGYFKKFGCLHRRRLNVTPARGFSLEDSLIGGQARQVEIGFLLHPDVTAALHDGGVTVSKNGNPLLHLRHDGPLALSIEPQGGWYSPTFGVKQSTARMVLSGRLEPGQKVITHVEIAA